MNKTFSAVIGFAFGVLSTLLVMIPVATNAEHQAKLAKLANELGVTTQVVELPAADDKIRIPLADGRVIEAPAGSVVELDGDLVDTRGWAGTSEDRTASSTGPGIRSGSGTGVDQLDAVTPTVTLGDSQAGGGSTSFAGFEVSTSYLWVMYIIGGVLAAGGVVVMYWLNSKKAGLALIVAGGSFVLTGFVFETYPWVALLILLSLIGVGVVVLLDYLERKHGLNALGVYRSTLDRLPDAVSETFERNAHKQAVATRKANDLAKADQLARQQARRTYAASFDPMTEARTLRDRLQNEV